MPTFTYMVMAVSLDPNATNLTYRKSVLTGKLSYIFNVVKQCDTRTTDMTTDTQTSSYRYNNVGTDA
jgi:hypothetical protein